MPKNKGFRLQLRGRWLAYPARRQVAQIPVPKFFRSTYIIVRSKGLSMMRHTVAGLCLFVCLASRGLWGQAATATITGTVVDATGAVVPGAAITAKNNGTGITRSTESDNQGRYSLADLAIGDYDVQAGKMGFRTLVKKSINL